MTFGEQLVITFVDKALIGAILLGVAFGLNRAIEKTKHDLGLAATEYELALKSQIEFKERQLSDFYGPIYALLKQIRPLDDLWNRRSLGEADARIVAAIRRANNRIVKVILTKSHLVHGDRLPEHFSRFLTHVAVWHAFMEDPDADWSVYQGLPEAQYDVSFEDEVLRTTETLKKELTDLHERHALTRT